MPDHGPWPHRVGLRARDCRAILEGHLHSDREARAQREGRIRRGRSRGGERRLRGRHEEGKGSCRFRLLTARKSSSSLSAPPSGREKIPPSSPSLNVSLRCGLSSKRTWKSASHRFARGTTTTKTKRRPRSSEEG